MDHLRHSQATRGEGLTRGQPRDPRPLHPDVRLVANLIEVWFAITDRQAIRRGTFGSVPELNAKIRAIIDGWNDDRAHLFVWIETAERILSKANCQKLSETRY